MALNKILQAKEGARELALLSNIYMPTNAEAVMVGKAMLEADDPMYCDPEADKEKVPAAKKQRTELKKGPFSPEEDAVYLELLNTHGAPKKKDNPEAWAAFGNAFRCIHTTQLEPNPNFRI